MQNDQKMAGRPKIGRFVKEIPTITYYKPRGIPISALEEVNLTVDEYEAIRLADLKNDYHADAAKKMGISRQTFSRIIASAHQKIGDALVNGKAIVFEGGNVFIRKNIMNKERSFNKGECVCPKCKKSIPHKRGVPCQEEHCPECGSKMLRKGSEHYKKLLNK